MITARASCPAPVDRLWAVTSDVLAWPAVLPTVDAVAPVGGAGATGPAAGLAVGQRFRVRQPGLPAATWEVTKCTPGASFTWVSRAPGVRTTATHTVVATERGSELRLALDWSGPLAPVVRALAGRRVRAMVESEGRRDGGGRGRGLTPQRSWWSGAAQQPQ